MGWWRIAVILILASLIRGEDDGIDGIQRRHSSNWSSTYPSLMICILARNKAHALPYFLGHLEELDYPKARIHLHIRTDHNSDATVAILEKWIEHVRDSYGSIDYVRDNEKDAPRSYDGETGPFDWNEPRYERFIELKEEALTMGRGRNLDYVLFVDADNFLTYPRVLQRLMERKKTIVAPMLRSTSLYSNFWAGMDANGYYVRTETYEPMYRRQIQGCNRVPMIHSTFLIDLNDPKSILLTFDRRKLATSMGVDIGAIPLDDVLIFAKSAVQAGVELNLLNTYDFGFMLEPRDQYEDSEDDLVSMRHLLLETLFYGPPGLLHSPYLDPIEHLRPKTTEPGFQFDHIYLINLKRRPDRKRRMEWCLRVLGINATVMEAADGKKLTDAYVYDELGIHMMPEYKDPFHKRTMTHGEIGCFLSHYRIWEDVRRNKYRRVLVFEDDLRFVKYFRHMLTAMIDETVERSIDWDLIYLGRKRLNPDNDGPMVKGCRYLSHVGYSYWTLSYALSYEGAVKLLDARPFENLVPVDEYLPIMFDRHPESTWKAHFPRRNLLAFTAEPLFIFPTHYTGETGYISDTENAPLVDANLNNRTADAVPSREMAENLMRNDQVELPELRKDAAGKRADDEL